MIYIVLFLDERSKERLYRIRAFMSLEDAKHAVESGEIAVYIYDSVLHIMSVDTTTGVIDYAYTYNVKDGRWVDLGYN